MVSERVIRTLKTVRDKGGVYSLSDNPKKEITSKMLEHAKGLKLLRGGPNNYEMSPEGFLTLTQHEISEYSKAIQENTIRLESTTSEFAKSTDDHSNKMFWLTIALMVIATVQVFLVIFQIVLISKS